MLGFRAPSTPLIQSLNSFEKGRSFKKEPRPEVVNPLEEGVTPFCPCTHFKGSGQPPLSLIGATGRSPEMSSLWRTRTACAPAVSSTTKTSTESCGATRRHVGASRSIKPCRCSGSGRREEGAQTAHAPEVEGHYEPPVGGETVSTS